MFDDKKQKMSSKNIIMIKEILKLKNKINKVKYRNEVMIL